MLTPDVILSVHFQSYDWLQFQQIDMKEIVMEKTGRYIDVNQRVVTVWFTGKIYCHRSLAQPHSLIGPL